MNSQKGLSEWALHQLGMIYVNCNILLTGQKWKVSHQSLQRKNICINLYVYCKMATNFKIIYDEMIVQWYYSGLFIICKQEQCN